MYNALYDAWLKEKENMELQPLPKDFYMKLSSYVGQIRQERRMLDKNTAKAKLVSKELLNATRMTEELLKLRFTKLTKETQMRKQSKKGTLTPEEEKILLTIKPSFEDFQSLLKNSLKGKALKAGQRKAPQKRILLRFLREMPAIAGADMKMYGPFSAEDVATLPVENARVLVKRGVAMEIEA